MVEVSCCERYKGVYFKFEWLSYCITDLGRAIRSHDIHTVAQVDALAASKARVTELEAELAKARGALERIAIYADDWLESGPNKRRIHEIINAAAHTAGDGGQG